jgi:hypothetical protein
MTSYLTDYTHFKNKAELDEATRKHRKWNWNKMNATDHDVLEMIWRHSIKFGAAQLAYDAIALEIIKANSIIAPSDAQSVNSNNSAFSTAITISAPARTDSARISIPFDLSTTIPQSWMNDFSHNKNGVNLINRLTPFPLLQLSSTFND